MDKDTSKLDPFVTKEQFCVNGGKRDRFGWEKVY